MRKKELTRSINLSHWGKFVGYNFWFSHFAQFNAAFEPQ
jgi:hypothetical protein